MKQVKQSPVTTLVKPKTSLDIVIPTLNEEQNLKVLIPYLQENFENSFSKIIVVDSINSIDKTKQLCADLKVHYLKSAFMCRSLQLNQGAKYGDGDAVLFLHADVKPPLDFIKKIEEVFSDGYCAGFFSFIFKSKSRLLKMNSFFTKFDGMFSGGGDQCHFFKKDTFEKLEGYDPDFVIMEDFVLV